MSFPQPNAAPARSTARFPDGGCYRIEIPSVEGPEALESVFREAARVDLTIHRVSQGSGVMMLTDAEIKEMLQQCAANGTELCLFLGPRASWDIGGGRFTEAGDLSVRARGRDALAQCLDEAARAVELGVRCLLVGDEGVLWTLHRLRSRGDLPADTVFKVSALVGPANPASFALFQTLGADSINVPSDLSLPQLAELRAAATAPIDFYVEAPDNVGGFVRHYDAPDLVRVAAPVYLKFGLRNAPNIYPSGYHLREAVLASARERVRRAHLGQTLLERLDMVRFMSPPGSTAMPALDRSLGWSPQEA